MCVSYQNVGNRVQVEHGRDGEHSFRVDVESPWHVDVARGQVAHEADASLVRRRQVGRQLEAERIQTLTCRELALLAGVSGP